MTQFNNFFIEKTHILAMKNKSENINKIHKELLNDEQNLNFDRILNLFSLELNHEEIFLESYLKEKKSENINILAKNSLQNLLVLLIFILNQKGLTYDIFIKHFSIKKITGLVIFLLYKDIFIKVALLDIFNLILEKLNSVKNHNLYNILQYFILLETNYSKLKIHKKFNMNKYYSKIIITGLMICDSDISFIIIKKMAQLDKKLIYLNLKYFSKTFSIQKIDIQVNIILFLEFIDSLEPKYTSYVLKILIKGFKSSNSLTINQLYLLFINNKITKFILDNINILLPNIFEILYRNSKRSWSIKERIEYSKILDFFMTLNPETFQKCLIKYNKKN